MVKKKIALEREYFILMVPFIGYPAVGKTSILRRMDGEEITGNGYTFSTPGATSMFSDEILSTSNLDVKISFYDVGGNIFERDPSELKPLFNNASVVVVVYDVSSRNSFGENGSKILELMEKIGNSRTFILVGNKIDRSREVSQSEALEFASENNMYYAETSAMTGWRIGRKCGSEGLYELIVDVVKNKFFSGNEIPDKLGNILRLKENILYITKNGITTYIYLEDRK